MEGTYTRKEYSTHGGDIHAEGLTHGGDIYIVKTVQLFLNYLFGGQKLVNKKAAQSLDKI